MQLVFSFYRHPHLGLSLNAYLIYLLESGSFSYQYHRLVYERIDDFDYPFTDDDRKILSLIAELSQSAIERKFNKKKLKWEAFLEKSAADKALMSALSAYFDRRISKCLELMKGRQVYWKERNSDHPAMKGYHVMSGSPRVVYAFTRATEGIRYQLEVSYNGRKLDLQRRNTEILSGDPCWLLHNGCIYGFSDGSDGNKLKPFLTKSEIFIPDKLSDQYLSSFMLKASRKFEVRFEGFKTRDVPKQINKVLRLTSGFDGIPKIELTFHYDHLTVSAANQQPVLVQLLRENQERILVRYKRDFVFEDAAAEQLVQVGLNKSASSWFNLLEAGTDMFKLWEWLLENQEILVHLGFITDNSLDGQIIHLEQPSIELKSMEDEQDWFDLKAIVKIGDLEIPFIRLRKNILERNRNWVLPDGSVVLLPEAWFVQYAGLFEFGEDSGETLRLHRQHHGLLDGHPLMGADVAPRLSPEKQRIFSNPFDQILEQPALLNARLRDYQAKGYSWLWNLREKGLGACLADDMGLGKTIQVIALLLRVKELASQEPDVTLPAPETDSTPIQLSLFETRSKAQMQKEKPALIVMAPSLIHNWKGEFQKFAPSLKVLIHAGPKRVVDALLFGLYDVILTTYGVVRNDIQHLRELEFSTLVLDESQLIKNMRSMTYQRVRQLRGEQRIVMTGTPVENSLSDLWSQLNFLQPGLLGGFAWFRKEFIVPVEKHQDSTQLEKLKKVIQPFIMRRTKEDVAPELPELTQFEHYCEMDSGQRERYEEQKSAYRNAILNLVRSEGIQKSQFMILRGLMQLRKIAIHPVLDDQQYMGSSTKFEQVLTRLEGLKAEGKKVLMFSQFVRHLDLYRKHFDESGTPYSMLTGNIPMQERAEIIQKFDQSKGFRVFLIQLRTGGSGLNLTQADNVFLLDPWWNPAAEAQAISRSHRIGQHKPVFAWKFITRDTIEEKILKLQEKKARLASDIIGQGNPIGTISKEELEELFS